MRKQTYLLSFFTLILLVGLTTACQRSAEGLKKDWNFAKERWDKHKTNYPSFAALLDKQLKEGEAKMAEADKISNEDEKKAKMKEAVDAINTGFIAELNTLEFNKGEITKKMDKVKKQKFNSSNLKKAENALAEANNAISEANKIVGGSVATVEDALKVIKDANSVLRTAKSNLDKVSKTGK